MRVNEILVCAKIVLSKERSEGGVLFYVVRQVIQLGAKCWRYDPIDKQAKDNCINCYRWNGKRCKIEAQLLAEWDKKHRPYERMMQDNRGVRIE